MSTIRMSIMFFMWRFTTTTKALLVSHCACFGFGVRRLPALLIRPCPPQVVPRTAAAFVHNEAPPPKKWLPRPPRLRVSSAVSDETTDSSSSASSDEDKEVTKPLPSPPSKSAVTAETAVSSGTTEDEGTHHQEAPTPTETTRALTQRVGIFVDLDNVAPDTYTRVSASYFVEPLRMFVQEVLVNATMDKFQGWGNANTNAFGGKLEPGQLETTEYQAWDGTSAVTGYDEQGLLRCGVCGAKMKLTKKDRTRGITEERKLERHMKMLHTREQNKRINRRRTSKRKKPLSDKEMEKFRKYESARVGVLRKSPNANDLFQVLRERGMKCRVVNDVDKALISDARRWMYNATKTTNTRNHQAVLVVVSRDSDFVPILVDARRKGLLAITVSPNAMQQTKDLIKHSDIVLEAAVPDMCEDMGVAFSEETHAIHDVYRITARTEQGKSAIQKEYSNRLDHFSEEDDNDEDIEEEWGSDAEDEDEDFIDERWDSDYDEDDVEKWKSEYDLYGEEEWRNKYGLWGDEEGYWRPTP